MSQRMQKIVTGAEIEVGPTFTGVNVNYDYQLLVDDPDRQVQKVVNACFAMMHGIRSNVAAVPRCTMFVEGEPV
eukprot:123706-Amphidinium_carterae.1